GSPVDGNGLDVEVIDGPEENRFTLAAVMESLRGESDLAKAKSILVEVGEGSTDVALLSGGELQQSGTFPLGSIRLRAGMSAGPASAAEIWSTTDLLQTLAEARSYKSEIDARLVWTRFRAQTREAQELKDAPCRGD
ncbi:MAG: hypothetical protein H6Q04_1799, partial [Acidobacteria bacterium]|nr:hypothetical protein [Acidobacteriota bacterium]